MANTQKFTVPSPYDQQMAELQRRQKMAELMQQQGMEPLESMTAPGGMVVATSPLLGLAKMLQVGLGAKAMNAVEKQRGEAEQTARTQAMDWLKGFQPSVGVSPDAALQASMTPANVPKYSALNSAMDQTESALGLPAGALTRAPTDEMMPSNAPAPQQQLTALTPQERQNRVYEGALSGNPYTSRLASFLMTQKPDEEEAYDVKYETGADGKTHAVQYSKRGKRVDLGEAAPFKEPTKATSSNIQRKTRSVFDASGNETQQDYNFNPDTGEETLVGKPYAGRPKAESAAPRESAEGLRKEFTAQTTPYRSIADAYQKIQISAANPSPANDISLVYGFMRINDPTSTVREGEFATAQNAGSVPERIRNIYNKVVNGERLTPEQRTDFVNSAYGMVESQRANIAQTIERFSNIARRSKLLPEDVVFDPFAGIATRPNKGQIERKSGKNQPSEKAQSYLPQQQQ